MKTLIVGLLLGQVFVLLLHLIPGIHHGFISGAVCGVIGMLLSISIFKME